MAVRCQTYSVGGHDATRPRFKSAWDLLTFFTLFLVESELGIAFGQNGDSFGRRCCTNMAHDLFSSRDGNGTRSATSPAVWEEKGEKAWMMCTCVQQLCIYKCIGWKGTSFGWHLLYFFLGCVFCACFSLVWKVGGSVVNIRVIMMRSAGV